MIIIISSLQPPLVQPCHFIAEHSLWGYFYDAINWSVCCIGTFSHSGSIKMIRMTKYQHRWVFSLLIETCGSSCLCTNQDLCISISRSRFLLFIKVWFGTSISTLDFSYICIHWHNVLEYIRCIYMGCYLAIYTVSLIYERYFSL